MMRVQTNSLRNRIARVGIAGAGLILVVALFFWIQNRRTQSVLQKQRIIQSVFVQIQGLQECSRRFVYIPEQLNKQNAELNAFLERLKPLIAQLKSTSFDARQAAAIKRLTEEVADLDAKVAEMQTHRKTFMGAKWEMAHQGQKHSEIVAQSPSHTHAQRLLEVTKKLNSYYVGGSSQNTILTDCLQILNDVINSPEQMPPDMARETRLMQEKVAAFHAEITPLITAEHAMVARFDAVSTMLEQLLQEITSLLGNRHRLSLLGGITAAIAFAIFVFYVLANIVNEYGQGIKQILSDLEAMRDGDLSERTDQRNLLKRSDELGKLAKGHRALAERLREIITQTALQSDAILSTSQGLTTLAGELRSAAATQANASEQASVAMEKISNEISKNRNSCQQNADASHQAQNALVQARQSANKGFARVTDIASHIDLIKNIVKQTNILALNAAVEAARAGASGKGFSVVAAEVRKLADRSTESTSTITSLVEQASANNDSTQTELKKLEPLLQYAADLTTSIAETSIQQAAGTEHITIAVKSLSSVSQNITVSSDQLFAQALNLQHNAENLNKIVAYFSISSK